MVIGFLGDWGREAERRVPQAGPPPSGWQGVPSMAAHEPQRGRGRTEGQPVSSRRSALMLIAFGTGDREAEAGTRVAVRRAGGYPHPSIWRRVPLMASVDKLASQALTRCLIPGCSIAVTARGS